MRGGKGGGSRTHLRIRQQSSQLLLKTARRKLRTRLASTLSTGTQLNPSPTILYIVGLDNSNPPWLLHVNKNVYTITQVLSLTRGTAASQFQYFLPVWLPVATVTV